MCGIQSIPFHSNDQIFYLSRVWDTWAYEEFHFFEIFKVVTYTSYRITDSQCPVLVEDYSILARGSTQKAKAFIPVSFESYITFGGISSCIKNEVSGSYTDLWNLYDEIFTNTICLKDQN
jgi:hypothetical protein